MEQETASLATQTLVLGAEVRVTGQSPLLICVQLLEGQVAKPSLAGDSEPDPTVTPDSNDPRQHCPSPPEGGSASPHKAL